MSKAPKVAGNPEIDPTLPKVDLFGDGRYYLCFTFKGLATAQKGLRDVGMECNLLKALDLTNIDAEKIVPVLYAALLTHQPKISPITVADLITFRNLGRVFEAIAEAYGASLADPSAEDVKADPIAAE